jgi:membrane fusion protein (multidrug efflux system)
MPAPFSRTLRALERDGDGPSMAAMAVALLLLAMWSAWFVLGRVSIYEVSDRAWLSVEREAHDVAAPVSGRISALRIALGQRVQAGQVLVELEREEQRARLAEEGERATALAKQSEAVRRQIAAARDALADRSRASEGTLAEARAKAAEAETAARLAESEAQRQAQLLASGLVSQAVAARARSEAEQRRSAAESTRLALDRLSWGDRAAESDRREKLVELERQLAQLSGEAASAAAAVSRLEHDLELRAIRAPVSGRIGQLAPLHTGSVVEAGAQLAVIVPEGELKVIADFAPASAVGRIHPNQRAQVRLSGFPSSQYGSLAARVSEIADEPRDGRIRVELVVGGPRPSALPLQHGLPGTVEVEVERVSPAVLVLRTVGKVLDRPLASPPPPSGERAAAG